MVGKWLILDRLIANFLFADFFNVANHCQKSELPIRPRWLISVRKVVNRSRYLASVEVAVFVWLLVISLMEWI